MSLALVLGVALVAGLVGAMSGMGGGVVLIPVRTLLGVDTLFTAFVLATLTYTLLP